MIRRKTMIRSRKRGTHLQLGLYSSIRPAIILTTLQYYDKKEDDDKVEEERNSVYNWFSLPSTLSARYFLHYQ